MSNIQTKQTYSCGCSTTFTLLLITLIILKATETVSWPWWLVLTPLYCLIGVWVLVFLIAATVAIAAALGRGEG